jgi:hypothetical protein
MTGQMGYPACDLRRDNKSKTTAIHRMVAIAFIDNPKTLPLVNHIDSNPKNNHHSNLEWVTPKENLNKSKLMQSGVWGRTKWLEVYKISYDGFLVGVYKSIRHAERENGFKPSVLTSVINRKLKNRFYMGYLWTT